MPLFYINWTKSVEWIVDGDSLESVLKAANEVSEYTLFWDPTEIDAHEINQKTANHIKTLDAVLWNGDLINPEDAKKKQMKLYVAELLERQDIECPNCAVSSGSSDFDRGDFIFLCPKCGHDITLEEAAAIIKPPILQDDKTINMFPDGEKP